MFILKKMNTPQIEFASVKPLKFSVDLATWDSYGNTHNPYRTCEGGVPSLASECGMCCLGFACAAMGIPSSEMDMRGMPENVDASQSEVLELYGLVYTERDEMHDTSLSEQAAIINDNCESSLAVKMQDLHKLFGESGHSLTFTNGGKQVYPELSVVGGEEGGE
tara:strand:+ start:1088 stop:1579 length:492 start_codon:yes stop_codon:yes gene_type:complete